MPHLDMRQFMCRSDNYGVIIHDSKTGATASIDAPDAEAVEAELRKFGRQLTHIFTTHHHEVPVAQHLGAGEPGAVHEGTVGARQIFEGCLGFRDDQPRVVARAATARQDDVTLVGATDGVAPGGEELLPGGSVEVDSDT